MFLFIPVSPSLSSHLTHRVRPSTCPPFDFSVTLYIPHHLLRPFFHFSDTSELHASATQWYLCVYCRPQTVSSLVYFHLLWSCFVVMRRLISSCPAAFNRWPLHDTSSGLATQRRPLVYHWSFDRNRAVTDCVPWMTAHRQTCVLSVASVKDYDAQYKQKINLLGRSKMDKLC